MKNIVLAVTLLLLSFYSYCQKIDAKKVPQAVKDAFIKAHPNTTASWEWEDAAYEANFVESGKAMSCVIDQRGTILETESAITMAELPASAKAYVTQHFKGKKWNEITKVTKANGEVNYEVNVAGTDVLFDSNGSHLQKKEKKEKD